MIGIRKQKKRVLGTRNLGPGPLRKEQQTMKKTVMEEPRTLAGTVAGSERKQEPPRQEWGRVLVRRSARDSRAMAGEPTKKKKKKTKKERVRRRLGREH